MRVTVDTAEIKQVIERLSGLPCATPICSGVEEPYNAGTTCLRCHSLQQLNGMLPEGERDESINLGESGVCPGCGGAEGDGQSRLCENCIDGLEDEA